MKISTRVKQQVNKGDIGRKENIHKNIKGRGTQREKPAIRRKVPRRMRNIGKETREDDDDDIWGARRSNETSTRFTDLIQPYDGMTSLERRMYVPHTLTYTHELACTYTNMLTFGSAWIILD